jgi:hypothetical protein
MKLNILGVPLLVVAASAMAMTTTATPPPSTGKTMNWDDVASPRAPAASKAMADDSSGMRKGTVEAVNVGGGTFHVYGQRLNFDAKRVKVFAKGTPASVYTLRKGANVRFTMDPADPTHRRVAVIYVD